MLLSAITGERLTIVRIVGMILAIAGVVLVARSETDSEATDLTSETKPPISGVRGIGFALLSALGFAVLFWLLGLRIVPLLGASQTVWAIRMTSVLATAIVILLARQSIAPPAERAAPWILGAGLLDTSAYVFNNLGMKLEQISVVSVLASLYGAVTVILATLFLKEPVSRIQWIGIVAIFAGIVLISR
jgi:drug/metabolite transporter (DMT)-like permease